MNIYIDTEYNGFGGELISLAMVPVVGEPFYMAQSISKPYVLWVEENVKPVLNVKRTVHPTVFQALFRHWICQFYGPDIFCDWHADAEHFCRLLAGPEYEQSLDFGCCIHILKTPPNAFVSKIPHNALADAIALKEWHES